MTFEKKNNAKLALLAGKSWSVPCCSCCLLIQLILALGVSMVASNSYAISLRDSKEMPDLARAAVRSLIHIALINEPHSPPGKYPYSVSIINCLEENKEDICLEAKLELHNVNIAQILQTLALIEAAILEPCRYMVRPMEGIRQTEWDEYMFGFSKRPPGWIGESRVATIRRFEDYRSMFRCTHGTEQSIRLLRYRLSTIKIIINDIDNKTQHSKIVKVGGSHE